MKSIKTHYQKAAIILASIMLCTACNSGESIVSNDSDVITNTTDTEQSIQQEDIYPYEFKDFNKYDFTILNMQDDFWTGAHQIIDYDETQSSIVESAIYERNRAAEERLNFQLHVEKVTELSELNTTLNQTVMVNDDTYDMVYLPLNYANASSLNSESTLNLYTIETLRLESPWWNQTYLESAVINGELHSVVDYINLMGYCYCHVPFFNIEILEQNDLDLPYDLVNQGQWTYDEMFRYIKSTTSLGSESKYDPANDTTATFGLVCNNNDALIALWEGCGDHIVHRKSDGMVTINDNTTRIVNTFDSMLSILSQPGYCAKVLTSDTSGLSMFTSGKAAFYIASLGSGDSAKFRESDVRYGVLPIPKLDETQENYATTVNQYTLTMNIPITASDPERTGDILCYMEYLSWKNVIPELQRSLSYKGLGDEESIEMMNIILDTTVVDMGVAYGWTLPLLDSLCNDMLKGKQNFASSFEKQRSKIQKEIEKSIHSNE